MTPAEVTVLLLIGALAGVVGGLFGIGGGLVMIPSLQLLLGDRYGPGSLHVYKQAALIAAVVLSIPAAARHLRSGAVARRFVPTIVLLGALGVVVGVALSARFDREHTIHLRRLFGVSMMAIVAWSVWQERRLRSSALSTVERGATAPEPSRAESPMSGTGRHHPQGDEPPARPPGNSTPPRAATVASVIGLPAGFAAGFLGIGGGVWAGPALNIFFGLRLQSAIATSSCMIAALAPIAAVAQSWSVARMSDLSGRPGWWLGACLAPGALLGGWVGAALTHRLRTDALRWGFNAFLFLVGLRLIFG